MIDKPSDAVQTAKVLISDYMKEHIIGIYLNARMDPLHVELISLGTVNASICHPREVFKPALVNSACSVILLHNHPSGDVTPSEDDLEVTQRLKKAGDILGIELYDSIIFKKDEGFYSFKEANLLKGGAK